MKRIVLWGLSTLSALVLLFGYHTSTSSQLATKSPTSIVSSSSTSHSTASTNSKSTGSGKSGSSAPAAKTSTVTGAVAQTQWGPVQVRLTLQGSSITKVEVLQYPSGNGTDSQINSYALPILVRETMDQQSSQINMVSGATVTSTGYVQSLQSALDQVTA